MLFREATRALSFLCFSFLVTIGVCSDDSNSSAFLATIYEPYLTNLPEKPQDFNPVLGGHNFDMCCQLAVNESLVIENNTLRIRPGQTFYRGTMATLEAFPSFPCYATFNGSLLGPHQDFWTPYSWCHKRCPGWVSTRANNFNNWLKPLVAFIFPALIFCLNIPRRRRIELPKWVFSRAPNDIAHVLLFMVKIPIASLIVTFDTIVWLAVVFSVAGPLLVSGIYEALLENRILNFLEKRVKINALTIQERAHLLFVVLLANLDYTPAWEHSRLLVAELPNENMRARCSVSGPAVASSSLVQYSRSGSPITSSSGGPTATTSITLPGVSQVVVLPHTARDKNLITDVKTKLGSMLDSQYSFGSTVGAPVAFYVGSFVYAIFEIDASWGSYQSAHQLAFGMLWIVIPHVAIVSSLLLAGNNPSVWQGSAPQISLNAWPGGDGTVTISRSNQSDNAQTHVSLRTSEKQALFKRIPILGRFSNPYKSVYENSKYKPAWMWNRGPNKAMWVAKYAQQYGPYVKSIQEEVLGHEFGNYLWFPGLSAFILVFIPVFFGALVR